MMRKLLSKWRAFHRRLISQLEVSTFRWYTSMLDSTSSKAFLNIFVASRRLPKLLSIIRHELRVLPYASNDRDKYVASSRGTHSKERITQVCIEEKAPKQRNINEDYRGSPLPIVFIHHNNSDYLRYSLAEAKTSNPNSTIYLLGDSSNNHYNFVDHLLIEDYFQGADEFSKIYRHYNTQSVCFELFNFQRWFILKEFLISNSLSRCVYLDSDVMLYADVTQEEYKFEHYDLTLSKGMCGSTLFLRTVEALADFCQFLMDVYTKKNRYHYDKMVAHFVAMQNNGLVGGVCDMTAFQLYGEDNFGKIGEVALIRDGSVYDPNINMAHPGVEMEGGLKKILWRNGYPYGIHVGTGQEIRFNSLHCQGKAKRLMGQYYDASRVTEKGGRI